MKNKTETKFIQPSKDRSETIGHQKNVSGFLSPENKRIFSSTGFISLHEAAKIVERTPQYLNILSRSGDLKAEKLGRNWYTTKEWLLEMSEKKNIGSSKKILKYFEEEEVEEIFENALAKEKVSFGKLFEIKDFKNILASAFLVAVIFTFGFFTFKNRTDQNVQSGNSVSLNGSRTWEERNAKVAGDWDYRSESKKADFSKNIFGNSSDSKNVLKIVFTISIFVFVGFLIFLILHNLYKESFQTFSWIFLLIFSSLSALLFSGFVKNNFFDVASLLQGENNPIQIAGEEIESDTNKTNSHTNATNGNDFSSEVLSALGFEKIQIQKGNYPVKSIKTFWRSGDILFKEGIFFQIADNSITSENIKRHSIEKEDIDSNSITSRTIKNNSIQGEDIDPETEIIIKNFNATVATIDNLSSTAISADSIIASSLNLNSFDLVLSGDVQVNQNLLTTSAPTFGGLTLNGNLALGSNTLTTSNTTLVSNLNADLLDGHESTYFQIALTNPVTGTGNSGYLSKFTGTSTIGNSLIFDNGTSVGIGTSNPLFSTGGGLQMTRWGHNEFHITNASYGEGQNDGLAIYVGNNGETGIMNRENTLMMFGTNNDEKMRITASGNIGIGTTNPGNKLDVSGQGYFNSNIVARSGTLAFPDGVEYIGGYDGGADRAFFFSGTISGGSVAGRKTMYFDGSPIIFTHNGGEGDLVVNSSGNVGIGTTAPATALDVNGVITATGGTSTNWNLAYTYRLTGVTDSVTGLDFSLASNNITLALTTGYVIPTTTQETNWGTAYSHSQATTNVHGLTFTAEGTGGGLDADTLDGHETTYFQTALTNPVTGTGTSGYLPKFTGTSTIGNSLIFDNGTNVGIGTTDPGNYRLNIVTNDRSGLSITSDSSTAANPLAYFVDSEASYSDLEFYSDATNFYVGPYLNKGLQFVRNNGTASVTIKNDGNVGIGTTAPSRVLDVYSASLGVMQVGNTNGSILFGLNSATGYLQTSGSVPFSIYSGSTQVANFLNNGNVGIGTTNPSGLFQVVTGTNKSVAIMSAITTLSLSGQPADLSTVGSVIGISRPENGALIHGIFSYDTASSSNNLAISARSDMVFLSGLSERMRINDSGNVGIGTTNPGINLEVNGKIGMANGTSGGLFWGIPTSNRGSITQNASYDWTFTTNSVTAMTIQSATGYLGIGTTNPVYGLDVKGVEDISSGEHFLATFNTGTGGTNAKLIMGYRSNGSAVNSTLIRSGSNLDMTLGTTGVNQAVTIQNLGNVGIGTTSPEAALDVRGTSSGTMGAMQIVSTYNFLTLNDTDSSKKWHIGSFGNSDFFLSEDDTTTPNIRLSVKAGGNVGIGTTSPGSRLDVVTSGNGVMRVFRGDDASQYVSIWGYGISSTNNDLQVTAGSGKTLQLGSNGTANQVIINSGNVGIGTTAPGAKFEIKSSGATTGYTMIWRDSNGNENGYFQDGGKVYFDYGPLQVGNNFYATYNGNVGIGTTAPGEKLEISNGYAKFSEDYGIYFGSGNEGYLHDAANDALRLKAGGSTRMWIANGGNVGIGTTAPVRDLQIARGAGAHSLIKFSNDTVGHTVNDGADVGMLSDGTLLLQTKEDAPIQFFANATEKMRIISGGNVGIGTTSPGAKLEVNVGSDNYFRVNNAGSANGRTTIDSIGGGRIYQHNLTGTLTNLIQTDGTSYINGGNVGIGTTDPGSKRLYVDQTNASGIIGYFKASHADNEAEIWIDSPSDSDARNSRLILARGGTTKWLIGGIYNTAGFQIATSNSASDSKLSILSSGNVGIGVTNPGELLQVGGTASTTRFATINQNGLIVSRFDDNSNPDWLTLSNYYGGTYGGAIAFKMYSGVLAGRINIVGDSSWGASASTQDSSMTFSTTLDGTLAEKMRITSGGKIGIGTTAPTYKTQINLNGSSLALTTNDYVYASAGSSLTIYQGAATGSTYTAMQAYHSGETAYDNLILQNGGGNVGIGTTNPGGKLHIIGVANAFPASSGSAQTGLIERLQNNDSSLALDFGGKAASGAWLQATNNGDLSQVFPLLFNPNGGNVGIGTTAPGRIFTIASSNQAGTMNNGTAMIRIVNTDDHAADNRFAGAQFSYYDGVNADARALGAIGTVLTDTASQWAGDMVFGVKSSGADTSLSEYMRIKVGGNVGIGTTSPGAALQVVADNTYAALIGSKTASHRLVKIGESSDDYAVIQGAASSDLSYRDITLEPEGGNVGIGIKAPLAALHVKGSAAIAGRGYFQGVFEDSEYDYPGIYFKGVSGNHGFIRMENGDGFRFGTVNSGTNANSDVMSILENGNVGIGTTAPSSTFEVNGNMSLLSSTTNSFMYQGTGWLWTSTGKSTGTIRGGIYGDENGHLDLFGGSTATAHLTVDNNGLVGIGTAWPASKLNVATVNNGDNIIYADTYSSSTGSTNYWFSRKSHDSSGYPGETIDTDYLGTFYFQGVNTSDNWAYGAKIQVQQVGAAGTYVPANMNFFTYSASGPNTNQFVLSNNGNVGIGTTVPVAALDVRSNVADYAAYIGQSNASGWGLNVTTQGTSAGQAALWVRPNNGNTNALWIGNNGNVGIGTTAPGEKLEVNGGKFYLSNANVSQPLTDQAPANVFGGMRISGATTGGLDIFGFTDSDASYPMNFRAYFGTTDPTDSTPAMLFQAGKKGAGADYTALADAETAFQWYNGTNPRMTMLGSGNVGIGSSSPTRPLQVVGQIESKGSSNGLIVTNSTPKIWSISSSSSDALLFTEEGVGYPMTIKAGGNVGIGTTAPGYLLDVNGNARATDVYTHDGSVHSYSDSRLKNIEGAFNRGLSDIISLNPIYFRYKDNSKLGTSSDQEVVGVLAQEVQNLIPEAVGSQNGYLTLTQGPIFYTMINAIKELNSNQTNEFSNLNSQVSTLNLNIDNNVVTVDELKTSVNNSLSLATSHLSKIDDNLSLVTSHLSLNDSELSSLKSQFSTLNSQMEDIKEQNKAILDFFAVLNPESMVLKDAMGNVDLLQGKLSVKDIEALGVIKTKEIQTEVLGVTSKKTSDKSIIKKGEKEVIISTTEADKDSKIYVTPVGNTFDKVLYVDDIKDGESFKVKINSSADEDINFNWMIIK